MKYVTITAVAICLLAGAGFSQTITGSITGTVTDPSAAAVPGAKVTATNQGTNLKYNVVSNAAGVYNLLFLPIGRYTVEVESPNFKKVAMGPFNLEVDQIARLDVRLEVGQTTQTVEVTGVAPILQTEATQTGGSISGAIASSLPITGRNFTALTLLMPGSVTPSGTSGRPYTNGNREQSNTFLLDGIDINETIDNGIAFNPNVDALAEVSVSTANAAAEFGNANGSVVSMALKSGTNEFHGNAFDYLRNDKLDANGFFRNRAGQPKNPVRRNIFGGTFGGPVIKNRVFFFMDYEGSRNPSGGTAFANLASPAMRDGNLSVLATLPTPIAVRDPLNSQVFPGNVIPKARIVNPVALKLFSDPNLYPLPNNPGAGNIGINQNYVTSTRSNTTRDQADVKIDARLTDKDNISGRYTIVHNFDGASKLTLPTSVAAITDLFSGGAALNWTRTISASMVNEVRIGYTRANQGGQTVDLAGFLGRDGNAKFGIGGGQADLGMSTVNMGEGTSSIGGGANNSNTTDNTFSYGNNLSFHRGRHSFKVGAQALRYQQNRFYGGNNNVLGFFTYGSPNLYTGSAYADFLLNLLSAKGRGSLAGRWGHRQWRNSIFFQDDFKIRQNLTLNLGMRWEYSSPIVEVADRQANLDLATGKLLLAGKDGNSRALYKSYWKQFQPRVGAAWTPTMFNNRLVVRGAFGITSYLEGTGANLRLPLNPPFFYESNINFGANAPGDIRVGFSDVQPPSGNVIAGQPRYWNPDLRPAFIQQWNFTVEYQFLPSFSLSAGYVGEKGTNLINPREYNQPLPGAGDANLRRPYYSVMPLVTTISGTDSSSIMNYNSLQVNARQRFSHGLEFQASYTYSKVLTDNRGYYGNGGADAESAYWQNAYDRRGDYGVGFFNATHIFTSGGTYDLPFGKGRTFGSNWNRVIDAVLGGWGTGYVMHVHSGFPVTLLSNGSAGGRNERGALRPNRYKDGFTYVNQDIDHWFGTADTICPAGVNDGKCAYSAPDTASFGTSGKATERAPMLFSLDMNLSKRFRFTESKYILLRGDFYNLPNHPSFNPPARNISTPSTFGTITSTRVGSRTIELVLKLYF